METTDTIRGSQLVHGAPLMAISVFQLLTITHNGLRALWLKKLYRDLSRASSLN